MEAIQQGTVNVIQAEEVIDIRNREILSIETEMNSIQGI